MQNKKYWLRGAIKGMVINFTFCLIILFIFTPDFSRNDGLGDLGWAIFNLHNSPIIRLIDPFYSYLLYANIISSLATGFIIGAIIGSIYGKIKNRKKENV